MAQYAEFPWHRYMQEILWSRSSAWEEFETYDRGKICFVETTYRHKRHGKDYLPYFQEGGFCFAQYHRNRWLATIVKDFSNSLRSKFINGLYEWKIFALKNGIIPDIFRLNSGCIAEWRALLWKFYFSKQKWGSLRKLLCHILILAKNYFF